MATTPTDDQLVISDRTVGVRTMLGHTTNSLKREALLFDQIGFPELDYGLLDFYLPSHVDRSFRDEVAWLQDIGIVREVPPLDFGRTYMGIYFGGVKNSIDIMSIPDEERYLQQAALMRLYSVELRSLGINAFPILETRRQIGIVFPSCTAPVLEVVLKSMPIPDDQTPWQDIIEFRNDPESMKRLRRLRVWVRKFAHATTATSFAEMKEEIEVLLDEYEEHMKLHRMKLNKGATETLLTVVGKVAEDLVKVKLSELVKLPFILRERKINLLEAELKSPNRELAFISMARERFSR